MLMVLSPAKKLDFETPAPTADYTQPWFLDQAEELIGVLRDLEPAQLSELMAISDKLAALNHERNQRWHQPFTLDNAKQAIHAFQGDVYAGMDAAAFSADEQVYAQQHLRILSGLYGVLRPLDLIQPYRLEMGTALANPHGKNLYEFWGDRLAEALNEQLAALGSGTLVNLASNEYFKAVNRKALQAQVITPVFKDYKNGQYKVISFHAKKARGMMAAWASHQRITDAEGLKHFDGGGYGFDPTRSGEREWVFTRTPTQ